MENLKIANRGLAAIFAIIIASAGHAVMGQDIDSTGGLSNACQSNPGNRVFVNYPMKIENGQDPSSPEMVKTECTIVLGPEGSFETDRVGMEFNGRFSISSQFQTQIKFVKSSFTAQSVGIAADGNGSLVLVNESTLRSAAGDVTVAFADEGVLEIDYPLDGIHNSLESSNSVVITGGQKLNVSIKETGIAAGTGIIVSLGGYEGIFKSDKSDITAAKGSVLINGQGGKSLVDIGYGRIQSFNGLTVVLAAEESILEAQHMEIDSGLGAIVFNVGEDGNSAKAVVKDSILTSGSAFLVSASTGAQFGSALVEQSRVTAPGEIAVKTGTRGETIAKYNDLDSDIRITISTGNDGSCLSEGNALIAPVVNACLK